jgi:hypothetical protein
MEPGCAGIRVGGDLVIIASMSTVITKTLLPQEPTHTFFGFRGSS